MEKHFLDVDDLREINNAIFNQFDVTQPRYLKMVAAVRDAIATANRYHPHEVILLTKAVSLRNVRVGAKKTKKHRFEDLLISHGFSIKPVAHGRTRVWYVGYGDLTASSNDTVGKNINLKLAIEQAVAFKIKISQEKK